MSPIIEKIASDMADAVLAHNERLGEVTLSVRREKISDVLRFLRDDPALAFDHITDLTAVDFPNEEPRFEVIYQLYSIEKNHRVRVKARVPEEDCVLDSATPLWQGANFLEREVYDMFGITFKNHPDLRRILMTEDYDEGYPLRKDFPVEGRGWRDQFPFLSEGEDQKEVAYIEPPPLSVPSPAETPSETPILSHYDDEEEDRASSVKKHRRIEDMLLNMGPQHPSTHGVLRIVLELEGETIVRATPHLGYLHRGVEKLAEDATYSQIIPLTDRLDYTCAMTNNYAFTRAVEKLASITVPERAEYIRTIVSEMQRLIGHLFWLGTQALDIGAMTVFFYTFREREVLLDLFELLCGARLTVSYFRIGGVDREMTPEIVDRLYAFLETFPEKVKEYNTLLETNRIWTARTKGVAVISAKDAISFGCTGPVLRGSGVSYDIRKAEPYGAYDKVEWEVPIGKNGDTYDRYYIRVQEMLQSAKILKQCLDQLPTGAIAADIPRVTYPPREKVMNNMESLIHHFMIATRGFEAPEGEAYASIEAPKGELGFYIVSQGGNKPYRCRIRPPSFIHMGAFDHMARGYMIADIVTIFGTYDVVMGECDR